MPSPTGAYLGQRRHFLCCAAAAAAGLFSSAAAQAGPWATACGGALPPSLQDFLARGWQGLDPHALWDVHAHLLGNGDSGSGCFLHPSLTSGFNLVERARHRVILDAACVAPDAPSVDRAYVERLLTLSQAFPAGSRWLLFAFEQAHDDAGRPERAATTLYVPDAYAAQVAARHAERFSWVASIHPYHQAALARLDQAARDGALAIKWLPGAMNIDLRDARCRPFYDRLAQLGLPLIVHCGEEKAVPGARRHELGNPLHVRAALDLGVRVIVAHCASLGEAIDSDRPSAPEVPAFELFARLMAQPAYEGLLWGDLSAVFQSNRRAEVWQALLGRPDWHARLLHGSDYPLPGLKPLTRLGKLQGAGLLTEDDAQQLALLREHNPLLSDLMLKRSLRQAGQGLELTAFATRRAFEPKTGSRRPGTSGDTGGRG